VALPVFCCSPPFSVWPHLCDVISHLVSFDLKDSSCSFPTLLMSSLCSYRLRLLVPSPSLVYFFPPVFFIRTGFLYCDQRLRPVCLPPSFQIPRFILPPKPFFICSHLPLFRLLWFITSDFPFIFKGNLSSSGFLLIVSARFTPTFFFLRSFLLTHPWVDVDSPP